MTTIKKGAVDKGSISKGTINTAEIISDAVVSITITSSNSPSVNENVDADTTVYTATARDPDNGTTGFTFAISGTDANAFDFNTSTGVATIKQSPNFEQKSVYSFVITASKSGFTTGTKSISLSVTNLDEVAPTITSGTTGNTISAGSGAGQVVYVSAVDDSGDVSNGITFSLSNGSDSDLSITSDEGVVTLDINPVYATKNQYSFGVIATDDAGNASTTKNVTFSISDTTAPVFTSSATPSINESDGTALSEVTSSTVVHTLVATDIGGIGLASTDPYQISGTDANYLSLNRSNGQITLANGATPDTSVKSTYSFVATVVDESGNAANQNVTLTINPISQFNSTTSGTISENTAGGGTVLFGSYTSSGSISVHSVDGNTSQNLFTFNQQSSNNGLIVTGSQATNFETATSHTVILKCTITNGGSFSYSDPITISVLNQNEITFTSSSSMDGNIEGVAVGSTYGTAAASVSEAGSSDTITYTISGGQNASLFEINANTGVVTNTEVLSQGNKFINITASRSNSTDTKTLACLIPVNDVVVPTFASGTTQRGVTFDRSIADNNTAFSINLNTLVTNPSECGPVTFANSGSFNGLYNDLYDVDSNGVLSLVQVPQRAVHGDGPFQLYVSYANVDNEGAILIVNVNASDGFAATYSDYTHPAVDANHAGAPSGYGHNVWAQSAGSGAPNANSIGTLGQTFTFPGAGASISSNQPRYYGISRNGENTKATTANGVSKTFFDMFKVTNKAVQIIHKRDNTAWVKGDVFFGEYHVSLQSSTADTSTSTNLMSEPYTYAVVSARTSHNAIDRTNNTLLITQSDGSHNGAHNPSTSCLANGTRVLIHEQVGSSLQITIGSNSSLSYGQGEIYFIHNLTGSDAGKIKLCATRADAIAGTNFLTINGNLMNSGYNGLVIKAGLTQKYMGICEATVMCMTRGQGRRYGTGNFGHSYNIEKLASEDSTNYGSTAQGEGVRKNFSSMSGTPWHTYISGRHGAVDNSTRRIRALDLQLSTDNQANGYAGFVYAFRAYGGWSEPHAQETAGVNGGNPRLMLDFYNSQTVGTHECSGTNRIYHIDENTGTIYRGTMNFGSGPYQAFSAGSIKKHYRLSGSVNQFNSAAPTDQIAGGRGSFNTGTTHAGDSLAYIFGTDYGKYHYPVTSSEHTAGSPKPPSTGQYAATPTGDEFTRNVNNNTTALVNREVFLVFTN